VDGLLSPGDTVLDIGANHGHFALAAAVRVGPAGSVMAFEPNPAAHARLLLHIELNRLAQVEPRTLALADEFGELTLHVPAINSGEATFGESPYDDVTDVVCPVSTVDDLSLAGRVALMKIDVEGFETRVLAGAAGRIERDRPIVISEIVAPHLVRAGSSVGELRDFFAGPGYRGYAYGTRRRGARHVLHLVEAASEMPDGDVVWLPSETAGAILRRLREQG